jgi:hypothetical protein
MARWYARFDSGGYAPFNEANWNSGYAPTDLIYREQLRIGSAFSGDRYRNGLIASRSLLSAEAYDDLTGIYRNGGFGVIAPGDLYSSNTSTFVSFSAVYTSSLTNPPAPGIITPSDYATRPTASVLSTDTRLGAVLSTGVGVTYNAYASASNAVLDTLNACQTGDGTAKTPYTRAGLNPSRTLHSVYHDADIQYYAWDDFTPGTPQNLSFVISDRFYDPPSGYYRLFVEPTDNINLIFSWGKEYKADLAGASLLTGSMVRDSDLVVIDTLNQTVTGGDTFYSWSLSSTAYGNNVNGVIYDVSSSVKFRDQIITTHTGSSATYNQNDYIQIFKVNKITNMRYSGVGFCAQAATQQALCNDTTNETVYVDYGGIFSTSQFLYSLKDGTKAPQGLYAPATEDAQGFQNVNGKKAKCWDGDVFDPGDITLSCT